MRSVADWASQAEDEARLPEGTGERFAGYGIMGLPFASGHVLAMRRFAASSVGPAYTSVWHRDPAGRWAFWQDQPPEQACPRYFSAAIAEARHVDIELEWTGATTLRLAVPTVGLEWSTTMRSTPVTTVLNAVGAILPDRLWRTSPVLSAMGFVAGHALRAGHVQLSGFAPNGQHFIANPMRIWVVADATAALGDVAFGSIGKLDKQATLGDFAIPQRGVFAIGRAYFTAAGRTIAG